MNTVKINFYTKIDCPLCDKGKAVVQELANEFPVELIEWDIYKDDELLELYQVMIPVVEIDEEVISYGILDKNLIRKRLLEKTGVS
ncbi:glutaredoxin family protein [Bacillus suaedaesalsae]|uniref:Glutaredoxin family protein n=1 Tax=Bacillus suaedaesalsae TaxID=2810349 RepID=A0ABS2DKG4_9BACI|nr:glutaredoxin family protein [Bacillus suaedaesalsae]MBM6618997.1 glutaredoxin family protein [Bacillus suaedaesalsae]